MSSINVQDGVDAPPVRPSPIFLAIVAAFAVLTYLLASGNVTSRALVFGFVVVGWVFSLTLHEFAHAFVAYLGGDRSVAAKGYLTLDPTKYTDLNLSLIMPVVFVMIGGIGLPGGAVWINHGAIKSPLARTMMSLAGPFANVLFAAVCLVPIGLGWVTIEENWSLTLALGFLGVLQIGAVILNMIPIPGFDGYGAIDPHLSPSMRKMLAPLRQYGFYLVFGALFFVPAANSFFWELIGTIGDLLGGDGQLGPGDGGQFDSRGLQSTGHREFRFWEREG